jgi:cytochrome c5
MRTIVATLVVLLAACGKSEPPAPASAPPAATLAADAPGAPPPGAIADPKIARLYDQTCKACHGRAGSGAPQAGIAADWRDRIDQGMDLLVKHTLEGYQGMPPLGTCGDCTEEEFRALIRYMAGLPA